MDISGFHDFSTFSSVNVDNLLINDSPGPSTSVAAQPETSTGLKKQRGRPRKVAVEGEKQRRKQMKQRKKRQREREREIDISLGFPVKNRRYPRKDVNCSKVYLPEGWKVFATKRSSGIHKGFYDLIYFTPDGERMRSRNDLFRWAKIHNSDIDPKKFLFNRKMDVLLEEENAKRIIFRSAGLKGKANRYKDPSSVMDPSHDPPSTQTTLGLNTILSERGRELMLDDKLEFDSDISSSAPQSNFQGDSQSETLSAKDEETQATPKKIKVLKPRKVPLVKTIECLKSPYFALKNQIPKKPVSIFALPTKKWIPPRSPYNLIQEDLYHDPWKLLIATIFLNRTAGKLAIPIVHEFLARWPSPHEACSASLLDILDVVEHLGLGRTRAATIIRFSHEYLTVDWKKPTDLFGIGKYGNDSYKVFCLGQWRTVESEDKYLSLYINWLYNACSKSSHGIRSK